MVRGTSLALVLLVVPAVAGADPYFPLQVGNWWAYEEQGTSGQTLARETWTVVAAQEPGEFHVRSRGKRLDGLRGGKREEHEFLRQAEDGLHKRFPAGRQSALDVVLLKAPAHSGTRWHDAQGECEVLAHPTTCRGPRGEHPDCVTVACRLGDPTATIVVSVYARGVGMVRQDVRVLQVSPGFGEADVMLPGDPGCGGGRSVLRLTGYRVR